MLELRVTNPVGTKKRTTPHLEIGAVAGWEGGGGVVLTTTHTMVTN